MAKELPNKARVVIVGGGVIGCSIAYHLTKIGVSDVVLLERKQLTSGTTWHAAGLIGQLRDNHHMTNLAKYTAELYLELEKETGQAVGYKVNGSLSTATNEGRMEDLKRRADMAKVFGLKVDVLSPKECQEHHPLIEIHDVIGGIFIPTDGQADPVGITQALAKGARMGGAQIFENTKVNRVLVDADKVTGVETDTGTVMADHVVLACGMWTRELASRIGVAVPLHACEHFYVITEPFDGVTPDLPVYRDYDHQAYYKEDAGKILIGAFETVAKPWGMNGINEDFCFDQLPDDFDHFAPILEDAIRRMPALENAGIQTFFCGPESFTPDDRYHLGAAPELEGLFVAAGMNSIGVQSAGGVGRLMADWIVNGHPPGDFNGVDIRRNLPFMRNRKYLHDRVSETLGLLYATHWPFYQYKTSRDVRRSSLHRHLETMGACFGEVAGWERANWFAPYGVKPEYEYSFTRQNWFEHSADEHRNVRENVGVFDQSSFSKFRVQGNDACKVLNNICANDVDVTPGRIVYTQWLNERGGIEADLTVTRLAENDYLVVTGAGAQVRDFKWLTSHIPDDAHCIATDVTSGYAVISVMGPNSRALLQSVSPDDLSNEAFPFAHSREIELGMGLVRASRITYVGELGWELYVPTEFAPHIFETVVEAGENHGLKPAGLHALNSLRMEKAYRHWGHDISEEETPLEAGLMFAVKPDKGDFIGRDAVLRQKEEGAKQRLVQFQLEDPVPLLYHNEPIHRDGTIVGYLTSGMYGHTLGGAIGLGYVKNTAGVDAAFIDAGTFEIEVCGEKFAAKASLTPLFDPKNEKIRI
ncbi:MAG: FAD-dependent oxidoreductase [Rhodospirillales bacterium]|nr:FAD-dependent oxidoreductase [Rhodospirillales bacterium]MBO6788206.1 FAD-dependent oxidoreductase [Rhodospirillales bacterium]